MTLRPCLVAARCWKTACTPHHMYYVCNVLFPWPCPGHQCRLIIFHGYTCTAVMFHPEPLAATTEINLTTKLLCILKTIKVPSCSITLNEEPTVFLILPLKTPAAPCKDHLRYGWLFFFTPLHSRLLLWRGRWKQQTDLYKINSLHQLL